MCGVEAVYVNCVW